MHNTKTIQVAWSHSALKDFEGCPRRYHEVKVLKRHPFVETAALREGKRVHKAAEMRVKTGEPMPEDLSAYQPIVDQVAAIQGVKHTEYAMALTSTLTPTAWFGPDVWVRGSADLLVVDEDKGVAWVVDYKTGSDRYPDTEQLVLMALMVFAYFPKVQQVRSILLFLQSCTIHREQTNRGDAEALWWHYRERVARIEACVDSGVWNPKQSGLCKKHCPVHTCEFNGNH